MTAVEHITALIGERYGLQRRADWQPVIEKKIAEHREANGGGEDLIRAIETNPVLLDQMMAALTVPETHFMRHHDHFSFLAQEMSKKFRQAPTSASLRIVSAGCSSGEEIYTLAMILNKEFTHYPEDRIEIFGCDISRDAVNRARKAIYRAWSFRGTPAWLLEEFFDVEDDEAWRVKEYLRNRVRLEHCAIQDFVGRLSKHSVDTVLFRNVGIYFLDEALESLFSEFHRILKPDGFLIVAPGDPRPKGWKFKRLEHASTSIYSAQGAPPRESARSEATPAVVNRRRSMPRHILDQDKSRVRRHALVSADSSSGPDSNLVSIRDGDSDNNDNSRDCAGGEKTQQVPGAGPTEAATIRALADRGQFLEALELCAGMIERAPGQAQGYLLRGQWYFSGHREEDIHVALDDFRRAVFIQSDNALARFWYANALSKLGRSKKALLQLDACIALLERSDDFSGLSQDDESSVDELRRAVVFARDELR